ncbi:MAG TPA: translation initiation factor IF-1 [Vicinamibacteria bacterium]|nr:translation initiation factor IF-1 [Vicinamibacteria bacterium]
MAEAERDVMVVNARVIEGLPNAMYRVELETEKRGQALVHLAGGSSLLRVLPGDGVVVELMPYDMGRGRIVRRR